MSIEGNTSFIKCLECGDSYIDKDEEYCVRCAINIDLDNESIERYFEEE